jgi:hypothetical protein
VPAEVLAAHAAVMSITTDTKKGPDGKDIVTITDPGALKAAFWALIVVSVIFYVAGFQKKKWTLQASLGLFIPPIAVVLWTMAGDPSAFNAALPKVDQTGREVFVIIVTPVLALLATAVAYTLDKKEPPPANGGNGNGEALDGGAGAQQR